MFDPSYVETPAPFLDRLCARLDQSETEWVFFGAVAADFMGAHSPIEGFVVK